MAHEHDCCSEGCAGSSLRQFIDTGAAYALNCRRGRNVSAIVDRDWGSKAERDGIEPLETPADEDDSELLLHLPFTHDVSISGILLSTDCDGTCPKQLRAFTNKEVDLDSAASSSATQAWDVACDPGALVEHLTRRSRFARVSSVTLHVPSSHNESTTRMYVACA